MAKKEKVVNEVGSLEPMKPSLYLSSKDLPEIKNCKVGKTYSMTVKAKMTSYTDDVSGTSARFEIEKISDGGEIEKVEIKGAEEKKKALEDKVKKYS